MIERSHSRARRAAALVAGTIALAAFTVATPMAAFADVSDNGGATRNDHDDMTAALRASIVDGPAKNVILLIGDGMGDSEITVARNYAYGAAGELPGIDALPLTGQYTTYSLYRDGVNKGKPDYVPDSAATGSAWATGTKSFDNGVSVDIDGNPQQTLIEIAKANGLRTGNVTTSEIQDATPAVQVAHVNARSCYGPDSVTQCGDDALDKGGLGSISEQLLDTRPDITLGGGSASFQQSAKAGPWQGETLFEQAEDRGYQVIADGDELAAVESADQSAPVLGLFTPGNFPVRYAEHEATIGGADLPPVTCAANPDRLPENLSLKAMTDKAISLLDSDDEKGFFLQVEGASIDKQDHEANACGQIGETLDLDEAVQSALAFAEADGNTLVIVTADHAHTSQIVDSVTPGLSIALTTHDGTPMKVSYGTSPAGGSQQHTGSQLRIAAYGPGGANVVGLTDQSDNFFTMANALELDRDTAALSAGATIELADTTVAPGADLEITAEGLAGDRQVTGTIESEPIEITKTDVIDGTVALTTAAPSELGEHTVTLTGTQSGAVVTTTFTVTADGNPTPGSSETPATGAGGGSSTAGGGLSGLASTGAIVGPFVALAALLVAGGAAVLVIRRRRQGHTQG
ncbi:alkaline phosphatase [Compostimonas suwonensis]|uniref:Alkaline phosphatase n=1 Tax=Compostimonas suwonensis TaxID=1048394 RepID=A0A2M9BZK8_9MICO|nr:alkaline phosphatase [Compostimonas suwonensis]PJJ63518.1 alkaline phosphatase [Compostimonas suwonensis]